MNDHEGGGYWWGLVTGLLIGAGAALLLAPRKGEELREEIVEGAGHLKERAGEWSEEVAGSVAGKAHEVAERAHDVAEVVAGKAHDLKLRGEGALGNARQTLTHKAAAADVGDGTDALEESLETAEQAANEIESNPDGRAATEEA